MNPVHETLFDLCRALKDYPDDEIIVCVILLDESASMEEFGKAPKKATLNFLKQLRISEAASRTLVAIAAFNDSMRIMVAPTMAKDLKGIGDYCPGSCTRLYGSVNAMMLALMIQVEKLKLRGLKVNTVFSIITDGFDQPLTPDPDETQYELKARSELALARGWTLNLIGIGVQASCIASEMGFPEKTALTLTGGKSDLARSFRTIQHSMILPKGVYMRREPASSNN
ncbi:MAG: vWA domain-containing protein [Patescibacteria group bacterium]